MYFYFFFFSFVFFPFSKKYENLSSYNYTGVRFKLAKYQHLELILRENKLKYTGLILNVADSQTNIRIELGKQKKSQMS